MDSKSFSGSSLEQALHEGTLTQQQALLIGWVKPSGESGYIGFSQSGCDTWVNLPTEMIDHAEYLGQSACRDHAHPVMKIALKEPTDPEGRILFALLAQSVTKPLVNTS